ncbi:hypothetical protein CQL54_23920 [Salmonella enterica subsp. enterica serovar Newport]|nr:hypothetical protein [Salmonella enterica subsp. enterica serovar Newport]EDL9741304.1 hypothetical protein [Salmonella enterica subsp. enterica serovar Newport]
MGNKPKGKCPFCAAEMVPETVEKNTFRRDKCKCTSCKEIIYRCRNVLFCNDYAKGGVLYDDELCPSCGESLSKSAKEFPEKLQKIAQKVTEERMKK